MAHDTERVSSAFEGVIARAARALDLSYYMDSISAMWETISERIGYAAKRVTASLDNLLRFGAMRLESTGRVIAANDPARNLRLGYAIVRRHGKIVKSVEALPPGNDFNVQFSDGSVAAKAIKKDT
jgi:exonuclease VII large subunit